MELVTLTSIFLVGVVASAASGFVIGKYAERKTTTRKRRTENADEIVELLDIHALRSMCNELIEQAQRVREVANCADHHQSYREGPPGRPEGPESKPRCRSCGGTGRNSKGTGDCPTCGGKGTQ